jgi:hypothetical protein
MWVLSPPDYNMGLASVGGREDIHFWRLTEMGLASTVTPWVYASMSSRTSSLLPLKGPLRYQYHSFSTFASVRARAITPFNSYLFISTFEC